MKKKIITCLLSFALIIAVCFTFAACGSNEDSTSTTLTEPTTPTDTRTHVSNEAELIAAALDDGEIVLDDNIVLSQVLNITKIVTLDLNGKNITENMTWTYSKEMPEAQKITAMFSVGQNGRLTIKGNGNVTSDDLYVVRADGDAEITIENGIYTSDCTIIQANNTAKVYVKGGRFKIENTESYGSRYMLNKIDKSNTLIEVTGGEFVNYNPAASSSEAPQENFVKDGFVVTQSTEGVNTIYTIVAAE